AILGLAIALIGEALGAHRVGQLAHPPLPGRQLLLGPLRFLHQALGAARPLLERRRLQGDRLELGELGPHGVVSRGVVARRPARWRSSSAARPRATVSCARARSPSSTCARSSPARALARRLSSNTRSRAVSASTSLAGRCASCSSRCRKYLPSPVITSSCES